MSFLGLKASYHFNCKHIIPKKRSQYNPFGRIRPNLFSFLSEHIVWAFPGAFFGQILC